MHSINSVSTIHLMPKPLIHLAPLISVLNPSPVAAEGERDRKRKAQREAVVQFI